MQCARIPAEAPVAPLPMPRGSITCTATPRDASSHAMAQPATPAPTIVTFTVEVYSAGSGIGDRGSGRYDPGTSFTRVRQPGLHQGDALDGNGWSGSATA